MLHLFPHIHQMVCRGYPKWCHTCFSVLWFLPIARSWPITHCKAMLHAIELLFCVEHNPSSSPLEFVINPWLLYPIVSLRSQWGHSSVTVYGFLASVYFPCCVPTSHWRWTLGCAALKGKVWAFCIIPSPKRFLIAPHVFIYFQSLSLVSNSR